MKESVQHAVNTNNRNVDKGELPRGLLSNRLLSSPVPTPLFGVRLGLETQHLYEAAGDRWAKNG